MPAVEAARTAGSGAETTTASGSVGNILPALAALRRLWYLCQQLVRLKQSTIFLRLNATANSTDHMPAVKSREGAATGRIFHRGLCRDRTTVADPERPRRT